jgi:uncharacterized damage-inducible protein DinB
MPFSQELIPEFDQEMKNTRALLERVPESLFSYQPHPKSMTLGRLAAHVAELPGWGKTAVEVDVLELGADWKPWLPTSAAELLTAFDRNVADARKMLSEMTDEKWNQIWTMKFNGKEMMSMPRRVVMRSVVMNHLIHHRAQLGVYLRLNNVQIPGMYGPSADDPKWWEPSAASA